MPGWVERFTARHGEVAYSRTGSVVTLTAADGAIAEYEDVPPPDPVGVVLVRRGGYAIGLAVAGELTASKCGTRYVQGQTKAGGWSQQRYARRRANQADELVNACAAHADRIFAGSPDLPVFGGGDRSLLEAVLAVMRGRVALQSRWLDVPDPRHDVLLDAVSRAWSYEVMLNALA